MIRERIDRKTVSYKINGKYYEAWKQNPRSQFGVTVEQDGRMVHLTSFDTLKEVETFIEERESAPEKK
jgi:hypothetical protein